MSEPFYIVFSGPPGPEGPTFIEVEDEQGRGLSCGEWKQREDGYWTLGPFVEAQRTQQTVTRVFLPTDDADAYLYALNRAREAMERGELVDWINGAERAPSPRIRVREGVATRLFGSNEIDAYEEIRSAVALFFRAKRAEGVGWGKDHDGFFVKVPNTHAYLLVGDATEAVYL